MSVRKPLTDEHKAAISAGVRRAQQDRPVAPLTDEVRAKISASVSAQMTPERRARISEQMKAYHARIRQAGSTP